MFLKNKKRRNLIPTLFLSLIHRNVFNDRIDKCFCLIHPCFFQFCGTNISHYFLAGKKKDVILHPESKEKLFPYLIVLWCNGSTTDSGPVCLGSNPSRTTRRRHMFPLPPRILKFLHFRKKLFLI